MDPGTEEFAAGWPIVLASAAGFGLGLSGLPFYTAGVFLDPLTHAFGWTTAQAQSGLLVMLWSMVALSPLAGWAADRFGPRPVALVSVVLFSLAFMALGLTDGDLVRYRLSWGIMAVAGAGTLPVVWSRAVNRRFVRHRGLALGLVLAGSGMTALLAPATAAWLIEAFGWRRAYVLLGALPLLISAPLVLAVFDVKAAAPAPAARPTEGADVAEALRSPRFWLISLCVGACSAAVAGCIPNLVKILVAHGQSRPSAVWTVGLVGLFVVAGRAVCGGLIDRFRASVVAAVFLSVPALACLLLVFGSRFGLGGSGSGAAAAILIGLAAGAEFDILAYLIVAQFGLRRYGAIYGAACGVFSFFAGAAPMTVAAAFDRTGSYDPILLVAAGLFAVSGAGLLLLGPPAPWPARTAPAPVR